MSTVLQIVADDLSTVIFDLNNPAGVGNPYGVTTAFGVGGGFRFTTERERVIMSPAASAGGRVVSQRDPLALASWHQSLTATTPDNYVAAVSELSRLLSLGGTLKWILSGGTEVRYIDFEPSSAPAVFDGRPVGLWQLQNLLTQPDGVEIQLLCQPYPYGAELDPAVNLIVNGLLIHDFATPNNRPDNWTWDSTTGISAEAISTDEANWGYQFTIADAGVHNLQQTSAVGSVAPGNVVPMQFEARVTAVAGTPQARCMVEYMQSDGTTQVGADLTTTITTLTTAWQRITLTPAAAGALTSRVRASIQIDNVDATSVTIQLRKAQPEVGAAPSLFRSRAQTVAYDPASVSATQPPRIAVFCQGTAPTLAKVKVIADAATLAYCRIHRDTQNPTALLEATLYKQLESGTLGADTTSAADANASGGNVARVNYTNPTPAFVSTQQASGTGATITITKPASLAVGDAMVASITRAQDSIISPPDDGWQLIGRQIHTDGAALVFTLCVFLKFATATDVAAALTSYTFTVVYPTGGTSSYRGVIGRLTGIDPDNFLAAPFTTQMTNANTTINIPTVTTDSDVAEVIAVSVGFAAAGALTFTAPTGTTPTYTEASDGTSDVTYRGMGVSFGNLATAGATGAQTVTASIAVYSIGAVFALRRSAAQLAVRSTVTFTGLPAGTYHAHMRFYPEACINRIRVEYSLDVAGVYHALPDYIVGIPSGAAPSYLDRIFGSIHIPEDYALGTLSVKVSAGLEEIATGDLFLDVLRVLPANEQVGTMVSPFLVGSGAYIVSDAEADKVFALTSSQVLAAVGTREGPTPIELQPGLNLLDPVFLLTAPTGFVDRKSVLTAVPTVGVYHKPRYRV